MLGGQQSAPGSRARRASAAWIGSVILASGTVASVVATPTMMFGRSPVGSFPPGSSPGAGGSGVSQVSVMWTL